MPEILPQNFRRRGSRRAGARNYFAEFVRTRVGVYWLGVITCALTLASCAAPRADLRALVPSETLVYLETADLGALLGALTGGKVFQDAAREKPDFSALNNVQVAVAVTGFETSETQVTDEQTIGKVKPHFVAVADTHLWSRQTAAFAENNLGEFVNRIYGGEVTLETTAKNGGTYFVWTATDGRKVYAFAEGSLIYFGNDESAIEKCLSVKRGETESLAKSGKAAGAAEKVLASGYVSSDGIGQIAGLFGVSTAIEATDSEGGKSFIARVLPEIIRGTVREISWTATKNERGIEDRYLITTAPEAAAVFRETLTADRSKRTDAARFLPPEIVSATVYQIAKPQIAWRSLLLVAAGKTDSASGRILNEFAGSLLAPYAVADAESFLSAVAAPLTTVQFDEEDGAAVVIAGVTNAEAVKKSLGEFNFKTAPEKIASADVWKSADGDAAAAFIGGKIIAGDAESVFKCLKANETAGDNALFETPAAGDAPIVTVGRESEAEKIVRLLGETTPENVRMTTNYRTETRFSGRGFERVTVSPFGLSGKILAQFADEK